MFFTPLGAGALTAVQSPVFILALESGGWALQRLVRGETSVLYIAKTSPSIYTHIEQLVLFQKKNNMCGAFFQLLMSRFRQM